MSSDPPDPDGFEVLAAWQRAMDLSVAIYRETESWPRVDPLDLALDMRRSGVIIPSVIARGQGNGEREDFLECLQTALDCSRQVEAQLAIAALVHYCTPESAASLRAEIYETRGLIEGLQKSVAGP